MRVVGVDICGADVDQEKLFSACEEASRRFSLDIRCYTTLERIAHERVEPVVCSDIIRMDESLFLALRKKKQASLMRALSDLEEEKICALVTCAHTGVVTGASSIVLSRFEGLRHPGLLVLIPSIKNTVAMLDVGAFVQASAQNLLHYVCLGTAFASSELNVALPRVGLLNIGRESGKGTFELKQVDEILSSMQTDRWQYMGNVEPHAVFSGYVDVLVTSGFAGNVFIKTAEGLLGLLRKTGGHTPFVQEHRLGALLAGVQKPVFKCHGSVSISSLVDTIYYAFELAQRSTVEFLQKAFSELRKQLP